MKISASKKQLAKIISENGGFIDGALWAAQDSRSWESDSRIVFYTEIPETPEDGREYWLGEDMGKSKSICAGELIPTWSETILSRDEYFRLYPAPDADGWIEWKGGDCPIPLLAVCDVKFSCGDEIESTIAGNVGWQHKFSGGDIVAYRPHKPEQAKSTAIGDDETNLAAKEELEAMEYRPSIEQLAAEYRNRKDYAERKQQEADAAKVEAEAKLKELVAAGKAVGLVVSVAAPEPEPEMVITDWRDLQVGDELTALRVANVDGADGKRCVVVKTQDNANGVFVLAKFDDGNTWWVREWRFIRRPSKEADNA